MSTSAVGWKDLIRIMGTLPSLELLGPPTAGTTACPMPSSATLMNGATSGGGENTCRWWFQDNTPDSAVQTRLTSLLL
jgi:hypothetical protein